MAEMLIRINTEPATDEEAAQSIREAAAVLESAMKYAATERRMKTSVYVFEKSTLFMYPSISVDIVKKF